MVQEDVVSRGLLFGVQGGGEHTGTEARRVATRAEAVPDRTEEREKIK
jgi:hypothetical protein